MVMNKEFDNYLQKFEIGFGCVDFEQTGIQRSRIVYELSMLDFYLDVLEGDFELEIWL